ncbi:Digeranylgeranylglycerophospholipid reductase [Syntrophobacter sp. SbD1]|nr:Digeranylgeranylglycerophospholipid reductase [Syntrophobacter sp. SbD1]
MKTLTCDIVVVGAGPAGTSAAREAASRGACVIIMERRAVPGVPVRCAEYIPAPLLGELGLRAGFVVQPVRGMKTFLNGRPLQEITAPGYTIRRDIFDQSLAEAARKVGAKILLSTIALSREGDEVLAGGMGPSPSRIRAKVIIGADGPQSTVGRWIGSENRNLIPAVQVKVRLDHPMEFTEVFFDDRIYGGYGWLFPKGGEANVGVGMKSRCKESHKIGRVLHDLLASLAGEGKIKGKPFDIAGGRIPAEAPRTIRDGNTVLVGDAAGHTHPITGAGILQAVIGGRMAGKWAARAVESGDLSDLANYESEWLDLFGETLERGFSRRRLLERKWDQLEEILKYCWVTFREYHEAYESNNGAGQRDNME